MVSVDCLVICFLLILIHQLIAGGDPVESVYPKSSFVEGWSIELKRSLVCLKLKLEGPPLVDHPFLVQGLFVECYFFDFVVIVELVLRSRVVRLVDPHLAGAVVQHEISLVSQRPLEKFDLVDVLFDEALD